MSERRTRPVANGLAHLTGQWMMTRAGWESLRAAAQAPIAAPKALEAKLGEWLRGSWQATVRDGVATIPVRGAIAHHLSWMSAWYGWSTYDQIAQDVRQALDDPSIKAIVLAIDSEGGMVSGVSECADLIFRGRETKPIDAHVSGIGASAAYWLAAGCRRVHVANVGMVGCLGTMWTMYDFSEMERKFGIEEITIISSQTPNKNLDPSTKAGRSQLQLLADELADVFLDSMARYRGVSRETVDADFGAGALIVGQSAVAAGLADAVGTYEDLLAELAKESTGAKSTLTPHAIMNNPNGPATPAASATPGAVATAPKAEETSSDRVTCGECGTELKDGACPNGHAQSTATDTGEDKEEKDGASAAASGSGQLSAVEQAKKDERQRIKAIRELTGPEAIKDKAIEDGVSPADAALRINQAQAKQTTSRLAAIQQDDAGPHAVVQAAEATEAKTPAAAAKASVDRYLELTGRAKPAKAS